MFCIVPPPGGEDFCHVGAATKPKSQRSKSQLCSERVVWVYEPSIWPQELFVQLHRNTFRDPKWHSLGRIFICPCADVVLWRCVSIKGIYWASRGDGLDMMSPAFYFFLRGETLKAIISPNHLQWPPNCEQIHTSDNCGKWSLFLLFKPTYFGFTRRSSVLPYKVLYNRVPPILSQYKSVLDDNFKAWAACDFISSNTNGRWWKTRPIGILATAQQSFVTRW